MRCAIGEGERSTTGEKSGGAEYRTVDMGGCCGSAVEGSWDGREVDDDGKGCEGERANKKFSSVYGQPHSFARQVVNEITLAFT